MHLYKNIQQSEKRWSRLQCASVFNVVNIVGNYEKSLYVLFLLVLRIPVSTTKHDARLCENRNLPEGDGAELPGFQR